MTTNIYKALRELERLRWLVSPTLKVEKWRVKRIKEGRFYLKHNPFYVKVRTKHWRENILFGPYRAEQPAL